MKASIQQGYPTRKQGVWLKQSEEENVLYDPDREAVHLLNATAMAIWVLCDGETTADEMIDAICDLSGLPRDVVMEDVGRILGQFTEAQILIWRA